MLVCAAQRSEYIFCKFCLINFNIIFNNMSVDKYMQNLNFYCVLYSITIMNKQMFSLHRSNSEHIYFNISTNLIARIY